jgi:putative Holliday junction resolvase
MRFLGVDPGGRRMGLAVADDTSGIATPLDVVAYDGVEAAARVIVERTQETGAGMVVVGLPTREDGRETPAARRSHLLAEAVRDRGVAVELQPELLSTVEARHRARNAGRKTGAAVDDLAAQIILEEYLERCSSARGRES